VREELVVIRERRVPGGAGIPATSRIQDVACGPRGGESKVEEEMAFRTDDPRLVPACLHSG
jgi:hypothetical protein